MSFYWLTIFFGETLYIIKYVFLSSLSFPQLIYSSTPSIMFTKQTSRLVLNNQRLFQRNFQSSTRSMNKIFGSPKEGIYSNLPFKVKGRMIPLSIPYWGVFGFFFAFPFLSTYIHLKKSGSLDE